MPQRPFDRRALLTATCIVLETRRRQQRQRSAVSEAEKHQAAVVMACEQRHSAAGESMQRQALALIARRSPGTADQPSAEDWLLGGGPGCKHSRCKHTGGGGA
jgi:hypothetical protein